MKKYLTDQILTAITVGFLAVGWVLFIIHQDVNRWGRFGLVLFDCILLLSWGLLCRHFLLWPWDRIRGNETKTVYYASFFGVGRLEWFRKTYLIEWKFREASRGENKTFSFLLPIGLTQEELEQFVFPKADEKVTITYGRCSKLLKKCQGSDGNVIWELPHK